MTGTTHGSLECIGDQWYIFYHRLTHKSDYSRQACAEKVELRSDGSIAQVEVTSCGLNQGPLRAEGSYPAVIACNLTNGHMPHGSNSVFKEAFPNVTNRGNERFIGEIEEGTLIGYKYFDCRQVSRIGVIARIEDETNQVVYDGPLRVDIRTQEFRFRDHTIRRPGMPTQEPQLEIRLSETGDAVATIRLDEADNQWQCYSADVDIPDGIHPIYLVYHGEKRIQLRELIFRIS